MIRNRLLLKSLTAFFIIEMLVSIVLPTFSWALTAGPTSPEATSFEPVDTTDLVDLKSGDFTYSLPLMEVPGPAGSYPISLSYHAGILPEVEASWTGLGFSLNPGSITRLVNGYPDDHKTVGNVTREFWEGGETEISTVGLSVGLTKVATVSADLAFGSDTYKGQGVGFGFGFGLEMGNGTSVGVYGGVSPFGESYSSVGASVTVGAAINESLKKQGSIGINLNSNGEVSGTAGIGIGWGQSSLMDVSISTNSGKPSLSVGGIPSFIHQQNAGRVSSVSDSWQVDIPLYYVNLRLGRSYSRYWIDETDNAVTYGSLYLGQTAPSFTAAFDAYDVADTEIDVAKHNDGEKVLGGSFPDVDSYVVTAQGLAGSIQPFHFQQELYRQDKKNTANEVLVKSYELGANVYRKTAFRFVNDFSNRFEYTPQDFSVGTGLTYAFDSTYTTGSTGTDGYVDNHLAGSKHVEWFSNKAILGADPEIDPFNIGFVNAVAEGFIRDSNDQIGGFSITNTSGVTYHYALPVYSFDEVMKSQNTPKQEEEEGLYYNEVKKPEKYAHTWHLTSVTGPDFVDRNNNGLADSGDWGYWLRYEYKKWISDYKWRNPGEGFNKDIDSDFDFYAYGKKELYHLSKIVTESHVAVFETSARDDGREVVSLANGGFASTPVYTYDQCYNNCIEGCGSGDEPCLQACELSCSDSVTIYDNIPRSTFKLDEIKLFRAEDHFAGKLSDENILKAISFEYDYDLAMGTPNSYDTITLQNKGKLTLHKVNFFGKGRQNLIPPVNFNYGKNPNYRKDFVDMWGYYKNDYVESDDNIATLTTPASAEDVDAWSLTSIESSLGSEIIIEYESDEYRTPELYKNNMLSVESMEIDTENQSIKVKFATSGMDLSSIEEYVNNAQMEVLVGRKFNTIPFCICDGVSGFPTGYFYSQNTVSLTASSIISLGIDSLEFVDNDLYTQLTTTIENQFYTETSCTSTNGQDIDPEIIIYPGYMVSGNLVIQPKIDMFGGGLRVKEISIKNGNEETITSYHYGEGVTTYEPVNFGKVNFYFYTWENTTWSAQNKRAKEARIAHNSKLYQNFASMLAVARQMPGPGVMYKEVEIRQRNVTADGVLHEFPNYIKYEFETFNDDMIGFANSDPQDHPISGQDYTEMKTRSVVLKDYTSRIGNIKSITTYALDNTPINQIRNTYLHDALDGSFDHNKTFYEDSLESFVNNQGVIDQSFVRARIILYKEDEKKPYPATEEQNTFTSDQKHLLGVITKRETYPSVQIGQTTKNFKTGITSEVKNLSFDFYSGEVLEVLSSDSYGNNLLASAIPAYHKYGEMGLKVSNKSNRHMLSQTTAQYTYAVNDQKVPAGLLSATVQTWSKKVPVLNVTDTAGFVWRKSQQYVWSALDSLNTDGTNSIVEFNNHSFVWNATGQNERWEKASELTLYDVFSHGLEAKDLNGNFVSSRMDRNEQRVIVSAINASYNEMAYSGAEYYVGNTENEGGVNRGDGNPSKAHVHTGEYSLLVAKNKKGFNYTLNYGKADLTKKYRASVWVYAPGDAETQSELNMLQLYYSINGQEVASVYPELQKNKSSSWYLLNLDITPNGNDAVVIGVRNNTQRGVYFDDFRVHPLQASLTSYVYEQFSGELNYILDKNNFYTRFQYDAVGRLVRTTRERLWFDYGAGKESVRADEVLQDIKYNYGKGN